MTHEGGSQLKATYWAALQEVNPWKMLAVLMTPFRVLWTSDRLSEDFHLEAAASSQPPADFRGAASSWRIRA